LHYWIVQTGAGLAGFVLNLSIFWQIKYTSSLTHNLVGTVKSCVQTGIAYFIFPEYEQFTLMKFVGFVIIAVSSSVYAILRNAEGRESARGPPVESQRGVSEIAFSDSVEFGLVEEELPPLPEPKNPPQLPELFLNPVAKV
jgi:hypothetical protein